MVWVWHGPYRRSFLTFRVACVWGMICALGISAVVVSGGRSRIPEYVMAPWLPQDAEGLFIGSNLLPLLPYARCRKPCRKARYAARERAEMEDEEESQGGDVALEIVVVPQGERSSRVRVTRVETEEACDDWVRRHVIAPGIHSQKVSTW